jgi:predicted nuclease of predicted toxin-antitoxin system
VTFLIDENLSRRLKVILAPIFPNCSHVADFSLLRADDDAIHARAKAEGLALLSRDDDFRGLVERYGAPPKLVFVRLGNVSTIEVAEAIALQQNEFNTFLSSAEDWVFVVEPVRA